jgi:hypothetical protein
VEFLPKEELIADLRRGLLSRVTDDVFLLRTILLTNQRLLLVSRRLGSFQRRSVFLKDVQGLASQRSLNWAALFVGAFSSLISILCLVAVANLRHGDRTVALIVGLFMLVLAVVAFVNVKTNVIRVSTTTEDIVFGLERSFSTDRADEFVRLVEREVVRFKGE